MKTFKNKIKALFGNNYAKGDLFEDFVQNIFPEESFNIVHKTMNTGDCDGRGSEDCIRPDFQFRDLKTKEAFNVECKFRSDTWEDGSLQWCEYYQLKRYKKIREEDNLKTYIMIGLGGKPHDPERLFCLDLDETKYNKLFKSSDRKSVV